MRGKLTECIQLAATTSPTGVLFTGEKYPKAAGDTGAEGPFQGQTPPFPRTPFKDAACGGAIQLPTKPESCCLPVRLFGVVTAQPVQRYPPRLVSACHSLAISMPHKVSALYFSVCPSGSGRQRHACISTGNILYFVIY